MRPFITRETVKKAVAALKKQKKKPTCGNLFVYFGGRGSMTSINKYRREALKLAPLPVKAKPKKGQGIEANPERTLRD